MHQLASSLAFSMWRPALIAAAIAAALLAIPDRIDFDDGSPDVRFVPTSRGTLVICGGGEMPDDVLLQFVDAAGGTDARIVVVTTASETADSDEVEEELEFWRSLNLSKLTVLHTRSRETANDPEFVRPLLDATGIWFIGGKQAWLADTYLGTISEEKIHDVFRRGGVVGGISAGAAIMSSVMIRAGDPEPEIGQGFGLLPGTIVDQHFLARNRQQRLLGALEAHPGMFGLGIDEGAAVVVHGRQLRVVGDSDVVACIPQSSGRGARVETMKPGTQADLYALSLAASRTQRANKGRTVVEGSAD